MLQLPVPLVISTSTTGGVLSTRKLWIAVDMTTIGHGGVAELDEDPVQALLGGGEAGEEVAGDADEDRRPGLGEVGEPVARGHLADGRVGDRGADDGGDGWRRRSVVQGLKTGSDGALTITRYSRFDDAGMARKPEIRIAPPNGLSSAVKVGSDAAEPLA